MTGATIRGEKKLQDDSHARWARTGPQGHLVTKFIKHPPNTIRYQALRTVVAPRKHVDKPAPFQADKAIITTEWHRTVNSKDPCLQVAMVVLLRVPAGCDSRPAPSELLSSHPAPPLPVHKHHPKHQNILKLTVLPGSGDCTRPPIARGTRGAPTLPEGVSWHESKQKDFFLQTLPIEPQSMVSWYLLHQNMS